MMAHGGKKGWQTSEMTVNTPQNEGSTCRQDPQRERYNRGREHTLTDAVKDVRETQTEKLSSDQRFPTRRNKLEAESE